MWSIGFKGLMWRKASVSSRRRTFRLCRDIAQGDNARNFYIRHQKSDICDLPSNILPNIFFLTLRDHQSCYTIADDIGDSSGFTHEFVYAE